MSGAPGRGQGRGGQRQGGQGWGGQGHGGQGRGGQRQGGQGWDGQGYGGQGQGGQGRGGQGVGPSGRGQGERGRGQGSGNRGPTEQITRPPMGRGQTFAWGGAGYSATRPVETGRDDVSFATERQQPLLPPAQQQHEQQQGKDVSADEVNTGEQLKETTEGKQASGSGGKKRRGKKKADTESVTSLPAQSGDGYPSTSDSPQRPIVGAGGNGRQMTMKILRRPDYGSCGREQRLVANCWNMKFQPTKVWMYDIEVLRCYRIEDETNRLIELRSSQKEKRQLMAQVVQRFPEGILFDGGRIIYSHHPLPEVTTTPVVKEVEFTDPINLEQRRLKYQIMETGTRDTGDIVQFLENPDGKSVCSLQDSLRILDCAARLACDGPFVCLGRMAIFNQQAAKTIQQKLLSIHQGFVMTVRPQWKLRINIDMTYKAFFPAGNLADVLYEKYGDNMCPEYQNISRDIRGLRLQSQKIYRKKSSEECYARVFTAYGVSPQSATTLVIPDLNQTVEKYFLESYGVKLKYPYLPCIKVKKDRNVFYPMELLEVIPFQSPNCRKEELAAEVIRCAAIKPEERFSELEKFCYQHLIKGPKLLQQYGITVLNGMQRVVGRELPPPSANFGNGVEQLQCGKWLAKRYFLPAAQGQTLRFAVLSAPSYRGDIGHRQKLITDLSKEGQSRGLNFQCVEHRSIQPAHLMNELKRLQTTVDLVIFILNDEYSYSKIKSLGDIHLGIRTQCVRTKTLDKRGYIGNLLLKINVKLDGLNWILPSFSNGEGIMVLGADVTHPSATGKAELRRSVGAVVGSISNNLMCYRAIVFQQPTKRPEQTKVNEVIDSMQSIMLELLQEYSRRNNGPPKKIIFYRDGVSEGQFMTVLLEELNGIQRACHELRPGYEIGITFIVVQKRHHLRLKPENGFGNVKPGTVVDTEITLRSEFDYYLCSQEGIQGTSRPAHYRVLYDDNNYKSDALQTFTFALCHAYMRCTRSVSYPAPTYYSHLAAFHARSWLESDLLDKNSFDEGRFRIHPRQLCSLFFC